MSLTRDDIAFIRSSYIKMSKVHWNGTDERRRIKRLVALADSYDCGTEYGVQLQAIDAFLKQTFNNYNDDMDH